MDTTIFHWINNLAGHVAWADDAMTFYAKNGVVIFAVLLIIAYLKARKQDLATVAATIWAGASALVALGVAQTIGRPINRPRPYTTLHNIHLLVAKSTDFSFPSDHATTVGAVAVGLLLINRRLGLVATAAALLMAAARIYIGVHYLSDVLAGLTIGGIIAWAGSHPAVPAITKLLHRITSTPLRPLLTTNRPTNTAT